MHRATWDFVSPTSWLGSVADEESLMGGRRGADMPTATIFFIPRRQTPSQQQQQQQRQRGGDEDEAMRSAGEDDTAMASFPEAKDDDEDNNDLSLEEDFFHDLPIGTRGLETQMPANLAPPPQKTKDGYAFFAYSYSRCATLSDNAELVNSTRRRYEDSAGRLKAVHSRRIGDKMLESTWKRRSEDDDGHHDVKVSSGDVDTFNKAWEATPFGQAEAQAKAHGERHQTQFPDEPPAKEIP